MPGLEVGGDTVKRVEKFSMSSGVRSSKAFDLFVT
jgi:hypothetical protein